MTKYLILIVTGLLVGSVCAYWAKTKNKDPFMWFLVGFVLNIAGLVIFSIVNKKIEHRNVQ